MVKPILPGHSQEQSKLLSDNKSQACKILTLFFQVAPSEKIRKQLPYPAIFQLSDYILFEQVRILSGMDIQAVLAEIPRLKGMVARFQKESPMAFPQKVRVKEVFSRPVPSVPRQPVVAKGNGKTDWKKEKKEKLKQLASATPPFPLGLTISHSNASNIVVTVHAWERFVRRYCRLAGISKPGWYAPEHFAKKMKEIFARSHEVRLSTRGLVRRLINNDYVPVRYFLDRALQLRFVVKKDRSVLLTVEIAHHK